MLSHSEPVAEPAVVVKQEREGPELACTGSYLVLILVAFVHFALQLVWTES